MQELLQYCHLQDSQKAILEMKFFSRVLQKSCKNVGYESEFFLCKNVKTGVFVSTHRGQNRQADHGRGEGNEHEHEYEY
jgi:hypothetical protein